MVAESSSPASVLSGLRGLSVRDGEARRDWAGDGGVYVLRKWLSVAL